MIEERLDSRGRGNLSWRPRMEQATKFRKLRVVRAIVPPDRRAAYLERWRAYARAGDAVGARAWLFEDEMLPGRFLEFTEYPGAPGIEARLEEALAGSGVPKECARRAGADERYREVRVEGGG